MKRKLSFILISLAFLLAIPACQELNELMPQGAVNKKNSKVLVREIATGAVIKGANGINFGPDGNLYIASFLPQEIIVMNEQNGKI
jgi:hypothetical protein